MRRRDACALALVALASLVGACGGDEDVAPTGSSEDAGGHSDGGDDHGHGDDAAPKVTFADGEANAEVETTLRDYGFIGIPASVTGPNVRFTASVRGSNRHELDIVDAEGERLGVTPPFEASDGERTLDVVLQPGTYTVQCLVKEGSRTHAQLGMRQELTVGS